MTGRPPLPIGAYGNITTKRISPDGTKPEIWRAECRYRDADGETRKVKRTGGSKTAATNNLKDGLARRQHSSGAQLTPSSRVREAAELWFEQRAAEVDGGDLAPTTLGAYRSAWRLHVEPPLGGLRLREITVSRCEAWQTALRKSKGAARTRTSRAVLAGVLGYAARMGAITTNPTRDMSRIPSAAKRAPRSMTAAERNAWLDAMEQSERARIWDLPDLSRFMLATGVRVGEALAVSWDDVDFDAGTVAIRWHLTRITGGGLVRATGTKRGDGRLLALPSWAVSMLLMRRADPRSSWPVFPDSLGQWRDPSNLLRVFRAERDAAGFGWLTTHAFRKTVATVLDDAHLSPRQTADVLGHADPAMTQRVYMQRGIASPESAAALEDLLTEGA